MARDLELEVVDAQVTVDGVDASLEIRGPEVTSAVSVVAANPGVRAELRRRQREWADDHGGGVIEGRDIGTVVFPDAELKVYLTASEDVRAQRRHKEAAELDYEETRALIADRDALDSARADSPLRGGGRRRHRWTRPTSAWTRSWSASWPCSRSGLTLATHDRRRHDHGRRHLARAAPSTRWPGPCASASAGSGSA